MLFVKDGARLTSSPVRGGWASVGLLEGLQEHFSSEVLLDFLAQHKACTAVFESLE